MAIEQLWLALTVGDEVVTLCPKALNIAGAMKDADNLNAVFDWAIEHQVLRELLNRKHSHATQQGTSVFGASTYFGLAREELECSFGGTVEAHT